MSNGKKARLNSIKSRYSRFERRDFPFVFLLVAFPVAQFIVFWVYKNISSIFLSFQTPTGLFTLNNIKSVFDSFIGTDIYGFNLWQTMMRSIWLWVVGNVICFPISIATTYVLFKRIRGHYIFRVCYIIPGLMGAIIWTSLIKYMSAFDGPFIELLLRLGVNLPDAALRNGLFGARETAYPTLIVITLVMGMVGNNAVMTGAFSRIPDEIFESSKLDGASFWKEFFSIAVPCIWPTIATLITFSLCGILLADANVFLYSNGTGEPGMSTMGFHLYFLTYRISLAGGGRAAYGYPSALGLVLTLFTLPIVLYGRKLLEKVMEPVEY